MLFNIFIMVMASLLCVLSICEQIAAEDAEKNTFTLEHSNSNKQMEFDDRLVGGTRVNKRYSFSVTIYSRIHGELICGGALITDRHVLTAAHCFKMDNLRADEVYLRIGGKHRNDGIIATVRKIISHERYQNPREGFNDIAILELTHPIKLSNRAIRPICLGKRWMVKKGVMATVLGSGGTGKNGGVSNFLQQINIPIVINTHCQSEFDGKSMICAGVKDGSKNVREGDSGGPLAINRRGVWYVIGVVSHGIGDRRRGSVSAYAVYTKVDYFTKWIDSKISGTSYKRC